MTTRKHSKSAQKDRNSPVKVGTLSRNKEEPVKDLSATDQKQIKGGNRRPDPTSGYGDANGG